MLRKKFEYRLKNPAENKTEMSNLPKARALGQASIGIVGSGVIGRAWALIFASSGHKVTIYDIDRQQVTSALDAMEKDLHTLAAQGALRGELSIEQQMDCVNATIDIHELVKNVDYIQECIPEILELKKELYNTLDDILEPNTIVASSTSTFVPSSFSADLKHKANILVAHPLNPPYFIPLVELVPAPWTDPEVVTKAAALMREIGQKPVVLKREVLGFATNRIQYAILNEIWNLIDQGVISAADADSVVSDGLGLRYALLGPLETAHLNANGVGDYIKRFGEEMYTVSQTYAKPPQMGAGPVLDRIVSECAEMVPLEQLAERRSVRDKFLRQLCKLKEDLKKE